MPEEQAIEGTFWLDKDDRGWWFWRLEDSEGRLITEERHRWKSHGEARGTADWLIRHAANCLMEDAKRLETE